MDFSQLSETEIKNCNSKICTQISLVFISDIRLGVPELPFIESKTRPQLWEDMQETDKSVIWKWDHHLFL